MRTYENDFGVTALSLQVGENDARYLEAFRSFSDTVKRL